MRRLPLLLGLLGAASGVAAQATSIPLSTRLLPGGLSVKLPAVWVPLDTAAQVRVRAMADSVFSRGPDSASAGSRLGRNSLFLVMEVDPQHPGTNVNLNVLGSPGTSPEGILELRPEARDSLFGQFCPRLIEMFSRVKWRTFSCQPLRLDPTRTPLVATAELVRTGPAGISTVRFAQYYEQDAIYTLTLTAPRDEDAVYGPLFITIYRSLTFSP